MSELQPLFLDNKFKLTFEKIAMPVKLSDDVSAWQREIGSEIYKQLPFIADYAVNVIVDRVDEQRGFAFGSAEVSNKSGAPLKEKGELPKVRIPLIVKDRMLLPLDVFMDGKEVIPLNPTRLREKLFRTQTFETSTRQPMDHGLADQLYPPMRSNFGNSGNAQGMDGGGNMGKFASLVEAIIPTISSTDADSFVSSLSDDPAVTMAASRNKTLVKLAMAIASAPAPSVEKTANAILSSIKPTIVQFTKLASGDFRVKWANASAFAPQSDQVDASTANAMAGQDLSNMQPDTSITLSTEKAKKESLHEDDYAKIGSYGTYKVKNKETNEFLTGVAIPVIDFEMHPLELFVFLGKGQTPCYALQDEIAGAPTEMESKELQTSDLSQAHGDGVLVMQTPEGQWKALLPMTIQNPSQGPDGSVQLQGETMFGEPVVLMVAPGLQAVQALNEGQYAVPSDFKWLPLENIVFLCKSPEEIENGEQGNNLQSSVNVNSTGPGDFSLEGQPIDKVAHNLRTFIKTAEAEFLLVGMGMDPFDARACLKRAESRGQVKIAGLRDIIPVSVVYRQMQKKAAAILQHFPYGLKRNLIKEAAVLEDADTVDKVLSMNFINPENIATFAGYLPDLDKASLKLAEMLMAARLGMNQLDEGAVERSMKNMEQVIEGLKTLQQKDLV